MKPGQNRMPEIARVEQSAKVLRRTGTPHGMAVSITLDAMAARARGDTEKAAQHLRKALGQLESLESHLIIAAVRMRLGQAVGGDEGRDHIEQADAWFKDQHVVAPAAFCQAIVPW